MDFFRQALPLIAGCLVMVGAKEASGGLTSYAALVETDPTNTFLATNVIPVPTSVNIGQLQGYNTYEFIVNGSSNVSDISEALLGKYSGGQDQAIKFDQVIDTGRYGATIYGQADDFFSNLTTSFNEDLVLDFVANPILNTTELFIDGVDTRTSVPFAVSLQGLVGLGGSIGVNGYFDVYDGTILAAATYNSDLPAAEIKAHSDAFFAQSTAVPVPPSAVLLLTSAPAFAIAWPRSRRRRGDRPDLPDGSPKT